MYLYYINPQIEYIIYKIKYQNENKTTYYDFYYAHKSYFSMSDIRVYIFSKFLNFLSYDIISSTLDDLNEKIETILQELTKKKKKRFCKV